MSRVDVVITTFNRPGPLVRCLGALARQTYRDFRVIVVDDGGVPPVEALLPGELRTQLDLLVVRSGENRGPGNGRNLGVSAGTGEYICFVDDDLVVDEGFLAAHLQRAERESPGTVLFGPLIEPEDWEPTPWNRWEAATLAKQYRRMAAGAYQPTWRQFFTGNAFLRREDFDRAGGFDPSLRRAEDIEMAIRLERSGCRFAFNMDARALHYAARSLESWKRIAADYARVDALIDARYPDMAYANVVRRETRRRHPLQRNALRLIRAAHVLTPSMVGAVALARLADMLALHRVAHGLLSFTWAAIYEAEFESALASNRRARPASLDEPTTTVHA